MYDVAVVGGGPAGAMAAWQLVRRGMSVILLEKAKLPRPKVCGGGIVWRARRMLPPSPNSLWLAECRRARLIVDGKSYASERSDPIVSMVRRDAFDAWLCDHAMRAGVDCWQGFEVREADFAADHVCLSDGSRQVRARLVVAADGASGRMARLAGWRAHERPAAAVEAEIQVSDAQYVRFAGTARFDFDLPLRGYGWVFPRDGCLNVGLGVFAGRTSGAGLRSLLKDYCDRLELPHGECHGYVIPLRPRKPCARGRVFLVGDAAGLADPVTAEGISAALKSASLLADAIEEGGLDARRCRAAYLNALEQTMLPELKVARRLARLLYASADLRAWMMRRYGERMCEAVTELFMGNGSYRDHAEAFFQRLAHRRWRR